jgi:hypothetical protein
MKYKRELIIIAASGLFLLISIKDAYAYLDPGSGSYLLQILVASILAGLFLIKNFWRNLAVTISNFCSRITCFIKKVLKKHA